jgi:mannose-6-phosphate isomerase-like protein (cupin superfamily)
MSSRRLIVSSIACALFSVAGVAAPVSAQDALKVAPTAFAEKVANDHVRVLDYHSKPGNKEAMHGHPACVIYVVIGGKLRYTFADGKTTEAELETGDVFYREPMTHAVENIGTTEIHAILVELEPVKK